MMADMLTPRLGLPLLAPGQAQKEMTHNEALALLDLALHGSVRGLAVEQPPAAPAPGQCWIVGAAPQGAWAGHAGALAGWTAGGWRFLEPREGMRLWVEPAGAYWQFVGGQWAAAASHGRLIVEGQQVVGARMSAIAEPHGGVVVDAEARAAIVAVLEALRTHGLVESANL